MGYSNVNLNSVRYEKENNLLEDKKINFDKPKSYLFMKRVMDIFGASIGLIILSPLFLIVMLLIKLEDPSGTIFFKQIRIGENGKEFYMYKFRTMVMNAEKMLEDLLDQNEVEGPIFKMKSDPRVTRIGGFLRKKSIDELPQLWNVLKGNMSLVGPRPPLSFEVEEYSETDMLRLYVTPGCTGLWQVSGRSNLDFNDMVNLDIEYIQKRSLVFDFFIIAKTFKVVITSKGAY